MNYCEQCGAANDIMNEHCYRCGHPLPRAEQPLVPAAGQVSASALGQDLELPDWLKRAAAETPAVPPSRPAAASLPPAGFHVAGVGSPATTEDLFRPEPPPATPRQLPPVPTAGLPNAMPDWLRQQSVTRPVTPEPDATDTSSFISESDLPAWIRQIAEADAAKKAEEELLAAQATAAAETTAPRRVVLPGETTPSVPAANPWLTRRDGASAAASWGAPAPGAPPPQPAAPAPALASEMTEAVETDYGAPPAMPATSTHGRKLSLPSISTPSLPKPAMPSLKRRESNELSTPRNNRVLLLVALIVLLLIVLATSIL
ncbi:MAG: hypothetical protein IT336_11755 [Thermomicrobiales bacterium]|nr:hypothetical protein [Thermomicrobiales bacterium]